MQTRIETVQEKWNRLKGNGFARRAVEIALAGRHSICFVGGPKCGKSLIRGALYESGLITHETLPCRCGNLSDPKKECACSITDVFNWRRLAKNRRGFNCEMVAEMFCPNVYEHNLKYEPLESIQGRALKASNLIGKWEITEEAKKLLAIADEELRFTPRVRSNAFNVAHTIAALGGTNTIDVQHIAEAIQYQPRGIKA